MQVPILLQEIQEVDHLAEADIKKAEEAQIAIEEEEEMNMVDGTINLLAKSVESQANVYQAIAFYATPEVVCDPAWYVDGGATNHVISDLNNLHLQAGYKGNNRLAIGNGQQLQISHTGNAFVRSSLPSLSIFFISQSCLTS
ncbi:hypothetical protein ACOSQ4_013860 [Xanthoceras sorbifolium]